VAGLSGVSKSYGDVKALGNVNFSVQAGELVALLGPNGAGKTDCRTISNFFLDLPCGLLALLSSGTSATEGKMYG
jgi:ABC-type branched-subunit amino acid transport system ATPase component